MIRHLRRENGLTQAKLAEKVGVTDKAVSKWERDVSYPDISLFPSLADVLGVTTDDLLRECIDDRTPSRLVQIFQMSHDIRTPLHIILGYADMARLHYNDTDRLLRYLEGIRISGDYLMKVLDYVLEVTYQDKDKIPPSAAIGDLAKLEIAPGENESIVELDFQAFDFSGRRFLLVEDMEVNREIAAELLRLTGAEVEFAENGQIGLDMLHANEPGYYDLVLMDLRMPVMDGIEATEKIREMEDLRKANVPVIAMTANVYEKDRTAAFAAGMNDFAEKPIQARKLFRIIQKNLK